VCVLTEDNLRYMNSDLKEQLGDAIDTVVRLRERASVLKARLVFYVDQGEGLTQEQLKEVYVEFEKLFPSRRRRKPAVDTPLEPKVE